MNAWLLITALLATVLSVWTAKFRQWAIAIGLVLGSIGLLLFASAGLEALFIVFALTGPGALIVLIAGGNTRRTDQQGSGPFTIRLLRIIRVSHNGARRCESSET